MIEEKIYSQEDLNNAVTKAITDMSKVLDEYNKALELAAFRLGMTNLFPFPENTSVEDMISKVKDYLLEEARK